MDGFEGSGGEGTRTPDLLLAKQVLYQLSYTPNAHPSAYREERASKWAQVDSNYRPHAYQACALTN